MAVGRTSPSICRYLDGTLTGTFTNDETDTLRADGKSYKGTFVFRTYDVNGVFTGLEVSGTIAASRITVS